MKHFYIFKHLSLSALLLLAIGLAPQGFAGVTHCSEDGFSIDFKGGSGKSQAAAQAQAQYGGKVLSVSQSQKNGQTVYKVKLLLDSGRIKIVKIPG